MACKLFVGGLSWGTSNEELSKAFEVFGEVLEAKVIKDRDTGRSRGFGFVTFAQEDDANRAMQNLNGTMLDDRTIRVNMAQERDERPNNSMRPRSPQGGRPNRPMNRDRGPRM